MVESCATRKAHTLRVEMDWYSMKGVWFERTFHSPEDMGSMAWDGIDMPSTAAGNEDVEDAF